MSDLESFVAGKIHPNGNPHDSGTSRNGKPKRKRKPIEINPDGSPDISSPIGRTDAANSRRFVEMHGADVRWIEAWEKWAAWLGTHWGTDQQCTIEALAKQTSHTLWIEVATAANKTDAREFEEVVRFGRSTNNAAGVRNMLALVRSEPGIPLSYEQLDQHHWTLNCTNGTLDLKTGTLRPHRRQDYNSKLCPVAYDPNAECPLWLSFLDRIMGSNQQLVDFIQRIFGYCLTGDVGEQILIFMWGTGANGKSTLLTTLLEMLGGDYAMQAPADLLMVKTHATHPTELADLFGKRVASCIETESGKRMAESLVKQITGGDKIRARRMKENFWEFNPTHKVLLAANHKPTIRGTDLAIWRRIRLIPFAVTIPAEERDPDLPKKLLKELPGILAWSVRGCMAWQANGLQEPEEVKLATDSYRTEMDLVTQFVEECCYVGGAFKDKASTLYRHYKTWTERSGEYTQSQRQFGIALGEKGFEKFTNNGTWYRGIAVREFDDAEGTEPYDPFS